MLSYCLILVLDFVTWAVLRTMEKKINKWKSQSLRAERANTWCQTLPGAHSTELQILLPSFRANSFSDTMPERGRQTDAKNIFLQWPGLLSGSLMKQGFQPHPQQILWDIRAGICIHLNGQLRKGTNEILLSLLKLQKTLKNLRLFLLNDASIYYTVTQIRYLLHF